MHARALLLVLLALAYIAVAQPPVFRIGGTLSQCGPGSDISLGMKTALEFYVNYTNSYGGVNINGTIHQLELIMCVSMNEGSLTPLQI